MQHFNGSKQYWEDRYQNKGTSGAGSYGRLAEFKAEVINNFVIANNIKSVIEFGCGDGNQLSLANYKNYLGVDVSEQAVKLCKQKFKDDTTKQFVHSSEYHEQTAELALSLDVIYHLIEQDIYENYLRVLFRSAEKFVIIYSSNFFANKSSKAVHVKHRKFTDDIGGNWEIIDRLKNKFPYQYENRNDTSFCDFYIFKRKEK